MYEDTFITNIEKALGMLLTENQKRYISASGEYWYGGRTSGKTTAHCIKLALSDGPPLNISKPEVFCDLDYGTESNKAKYARSYYLNMFLEIRFMLAKAGFRVRKVYKKANL